MTHPHPKDPQAELRHSIHMKMLEKSESAKDAGELTVVPLGFAVNIALALIQAHQQELLSELLGELPEKIEEGDGWDIYFTNGKEKGKVRPCCPGDDIAYVQNKTIDQVAEILNRKIGELNG